MADETGNDDNWFSDETATFGDRLAGAREQAGLSAADLALKLGVDEESLTAWEHDLREPRANRLQMLTGILGVSVGWLLTGVGEGPDNLDTGSLPGDVAEIMAEMRELTARMSEMTTRAAVLEKRLRAVLSA